MNVRFTPARYGSFEKVAVDQVSSEVPTVFLRQVNARCWVVYDKDFTRGGTFRDEKTALRFIRGDISDDAVVIVVRRSEHRTATSQSILLSNGRGRWEQR